jgi:catechol 2,3-dioxygenase-like lactoylglutathione lyase family enzyme
VTPVHLDQLNLVVRDVAANRAFYSRLGLDFGEDNDPVWANHFAGSVQAEHAAIDLDLHSTSFVQKWDAGWPGGTGVVIGFKVDSRQEVDDLVATLRAEGVPVQQEPFDAFWGARYAVVGDPDGNSVGIMSPIDPATRSEPPSPT